MQEPVTEFCALSMEPYGARCTVKRWSDYNSFKFRCAGVSADQDGPRLSSAATSPVASVGKRPKDDAGVFIDGMPKIHGEGKNNHKEEEIDAKQRMQ